MSELANMFLLFAKLMFGGIIFSLIIAFSVGYLRYLYLNHYTACEYLQTIKSKKKYTAVVFIIVGLSSMILAWYIAFS